MNQNIDLSIKSPCNKNYNEFNKTNAGGFCNSCEKEVIDFTQMSDNEIVRFFKTKQGNTCGRFQSAQLKSYKENNSSKNWTSFKKLYAGILSASFLSFLSVNDSNAQVCKKPIETYIKQKENLKKNKQDETGRVDQLIQGIVVDDTGEPLPGVSVVLKNSTIGITTNIDGLFQLKVPIKIGDALFFSFIGYKTQEYLFTQMPPKGIKITMSNDVEVLGMVVMGELETNDIYASKRSLWQKIKSIFK